MSKRCRVGVTMRVVEASGYTDSRDALSHDWIRLLDRAGFDVVMIPNVVEDPIAFVQRLSVDILLLSNGDDIHPALYGACAQQGKNYCLERDSTEVSLFDWAISCSKPVLAVCRGFQLVQVLLGGRLITNLSKQRDLEHVAIEHEITIVDDRTLRHFGKSIALVNSFHQQGIDINDLAEGLNPIAIDLNHIVEAYSMPGKSVLGVQWHPERNSFQDNIGRDMAIEFLVNGRWW